jgi:four helix bundle protein
MVVRHYQDLVVWQKATELVTRVYEVSESFPRREVFGLTNQIRRAAVSVPSNIVEGQGRETTRDFLRFLSMAKRSLQKAETQLLIALRLHYLDDCDTAGLFRDLWKHRATLERAHEVPDAD